MAFKILRLALSWLHDVAKFDAVLLATTADDEDSLATSLGGAIRLREAPDFR